MKKLVFLIIAIVAFAASSYAFNGGRVVCGPNGYDYKSYNIHGLWAYLESSCGIYGNSACSTLILYLNGNRVYVKDVISYPGSSNLFSTTNLPYCDSAEFYLSATGTGTGASWWAMFPGY